MTTPNATMSDRHVVSWRVPAPNKQEEDAQLLYIMVFASLLSPVVSMLRNIYGGREQRLLPAGR
jgi:hypothetical protein